MKAPCQKCEDRTLGCHSSCEKYLEFKGAVEEAKKEKVEGAVYGYVHRSSVLKALKRKRGHLPNLDY